MKEDGLVFLSTAGSTFYTLVAPRRHSLKKRRAGTQTHRLPETVLQREAEAPRFRVVVCQDTGRFEILGVPPIDLVA